MRGASDPRARVRTVEVALPLPLMQTLTYSVPDHWADPAPGSRVEAPFGRKRAIGVVVPADTTVGRSAVVPGAAGEGPRLRDVTAVVDDEPSIPPALLELSLWIADYYIAPPGLCARLVAPPGGVTTSKAVVELRREPLPEEHAADPILAALAAAGGSLPLAALCARLDRDVSARVARLEREGLVASVARLDTTGFLEARVVVASEELSAALSTLRGRARDVADRIIAAGGRALLRELAASIPSARPAVSSLARRGLARVETGVLDRSPATDGVAAPGGGHHPARALSREQGNALEAIGRGIDAATFSPFLLEGVTGSGKTEVYLRAAALALESGRSALLLVPEIGLTSPLVTAARERFGAAVSVLHSDMADGVRHDEWWRARRGSARVIVGARSAIFAPLSDLGLIVVDEEHDAAYKQDEAPRYHGRDVAIYRARLEGAAVVLGSATPSLESRSNAARGRYAWLRMRGRIGASGLAHVTLIDRRRQKDPLAILTPPLVSALAERLSRNEQSLLLLNRRGYATSLACRECGAAAQCPHCSVALVLHRRGDEARCHYCGLTRATPDACAACGGRYLRMQGYGTQRVAEALATALPAARVERVDRDVAGRRGAVEAALARFARHERDILLGTQMVAKGHDFPRVTFVGVIDADVGLGLPDFRSAERTFALLTQVAGRSGRADLPGEVALQTMNPSHYAIDFARRQDYDAFFERESEFRRTMGYPPERPMVNVVLRGASEQAVARDARAIAQDLKALGGFAVLGPAAAPLAKVRDEYRYQVVLRGPRSRIRSAARNALTRRLGTMVWAGVHVDVDPQSLL
jgi:primosomal protein N' (replication factor Y)